MDLEREIQVKKAEVETLIQMLDNAKKDLRRLEQRKEESYGESRS